MKELPLWLKTILNECGKDFFKKTGYFGLGATHNNTTLPGDTPQDCTPAC